MKRKKPPPKTRQSGAKPGPKSSCTKEVCEEARRLALLGATRKQMAEWFGKDPTTIGHWYKTQPRFRRAVDHGSSHADGKVAEAMYHTALGYEHRAVKFFKVPVEKEEYDEEGNLVSVTKTQKIKKVYYTKKYKPDTKAMIKFLGVRNRETWGQADKVEHRHAHLHAGDMSVHHLMEQVSEPGKFSDEELAALEKLGLAEKTRQLGANGSGE